MSCLNKELERKENNGGEGRRGKRMRSCGKFRVRIPEIGETETKEIRGAEFSGAGVERGRVVSRRYVICSAAAGCGQRSGERTATAPQTL